jgi:hypothetical protein
MKKKKASVIIYIKIHKSKKKKKKKKKKGGGVSIKDFQRVVASHDGGMTRSYGLLTGFSTEAPHSLRILPLFVIHVKTKINYLFFFF